MTSNRTNLGHIEPNRKTGEESFVSGEDRRNFSLLDFWQWSVSDLVSNATRGILAEFIVARALGVRTSNEIRGDWDTYDLDTPEGIKVEVKSSAYVQSWGQKAFSNPSFRIGKTYGYDPRTGEYTKDRRRWADVYVFALLKHREKLTINPLDLDQWAFHAISASILDEVKEDAKSISLNAVAELADAVAFDDLKTAVARAARKG